MTGGGHGARRVDVIGAMDVRSWCVGIVATHRASAGRAWAANPGRPDMEATRANEAMMRAVAVFVGRAVRGATPRHCRPAPSRNVALAVRRPGGPRGNPVVTGRQSGLAASRARGFAKKIAGARVMTRC